MTLASLVMKAAAKIATKGGGRAAKAAAKASAKPTGGGLATFTRTYAKGAKAGTTETVTIAAGKGRAAKAPAPTMSQATDAAAAKVAMPTKAKRAAKAPRAAKPTVADDLATLAKRAGLAPDDPLVAKLGRKMKAAAAPKAPKKPAPVVDTADAKRIANRLAGVNFREHQFKSVLADLKRQKMSKATVEAIANSFLDHPTTWKYKSIAEAWKKIEERHFLDNLSESRARTINSINV